MNEYREAKILGLISYFAKHTKYCGITKLFKLLFAADCELLKETGKTISGLDYFTYPAGPVPKELYEDFSDETSFFAENIEFKIPRFGKLKQIHTKYKFDEKLFSKRELDIIQRIAVIFKDAYARDMTKISHQIDQPWTTTKKTKGDLQKIDAETILNSFSEKNITLEEFNEREEESRSVLDIVHLTIGLLLFSKIKSE